MSGKEKDASCTESVMQKKEMNRWRGNGGKCAIRSRGINE